MNKYYKWFEVIGLTSALSSIIIIYATWIYSRVVEGSVYFLAGEPNNFILIIEWSLGIVSAVVLSSELKRKVDTCIS